MLLTKRLELARFRMLNDHHCPKCQVEEEHADYLSCRCSKWYSCPTRKFILSCQSNGSLLLEMLLRSYLMVLWCIKVWQHHVLVIRDEIGPIVAGSKRIGILASYIGAPLVEGTTLQESLLKAREKGLMNWCIVVESDSQLIFNCEDDIYGVSSRNHSRHQI